MSDFLADIAERSLTNEQAIRPRPLSVFEPLLAIASSGPLQLPEAGQDYEGTTSDTVNTVSRAPVAMSTKDFPAEALPKAMQAQRLSVPRVMADRNAAELAPVEQLQRQGMLGLAEGEAQRLGSSSLIGAPQPFVPTPVRQSAEYRPDVMQPPTEPIPFPEEGVPAVDAFSPASEFRQKSPRESLDQQQAASPSSLPASTKRADRGEQELRVPVHQSKTAGGLLEGNVVKPVIERVEMERPAPGQSLNQPVAPLSSRLETVWGKRDESIEKQASPPTIHVTIGRIEVRATPAPIQNRLQPKPPRETMSLDEYLRRRNGDGR